MGENEESFKITPPHYIKEFFVGVGKWGPAWVMAFMLGMGMYLLTTRVMARADAREDALINALSVLDSMQKGLNEHMSTSARTQLFISVMCSNNANTSQQRRACFDEYYAREMKERETNR